MTEAPELRPFVPAFHGRRRGFHLPAGAGRRRDGQEGGGGGEEELEYVVIENLIHGMRDPVVMGVKMGTR